MQRCRRDKTSKVQSGRECRYRQSTLCPDSSLSSKKARCRTKLVGVFLKLMAMGKKRQEVAGGGIGRSCFDLISFISLFLAPASRGVSKRTIQPNFDCIKSSSDGTTPDARSMAMASSRMNLEDRRNAKGARHRHRRSQSQIVSELRLRLRWFDEP